MDSLYKNSIVARMDSLYSYKNSIVARMDSLYEYKNSIAARVGTTYKNSDLARPLQEVVQ